MQAAASQPSVFTGSVPCCLNNAVGSGLFRLLSHLSRRRVVLSFFALAAVAIVFFVNRTNNRRLSEVGGRIKPQAPLQAISGYLGRVEANICAYPSFVLTGDRAALIKRLNLDDADYTEFEQEDATARARVGPSPQKSPASANYTVIYNFASPEPVKKSRGGGDKEEDRAGYENLGDDEDDEGGESGEDAEDVAPEIDESHLTYVTHSTPESLYPKLVGLLDHWNTGGSGGDSTHPISVAVYAPGNDFCTASAVVSWLWTCNKQVRRQVSFHVFFPSGFANDIASKTAGDGIRILDVDCSKKPSLSESRSYRVRHRLPYPANVARNVARTVAGTKFIVSSEAGLLPSRDLADKFIKFAEGGEAKRLGEEESGRPLVYVLPAFQVVAEPLQSFPETKTDLTEAYNAGRVSYLDKPSCHFCGKFPGLHKWVKAEAGDSLSVFYTAEKTVPNQRWEPAFIGNQDVPLLDDRLGSDRTTHYFELCLLRYRFAILDSAFLLRTSNATENSSGANRGDRTIKDAISELESKYGDNEDKCKVS